jgi:hypothetical protein
MVSMAATTLERAVLNGCQQPLIQPSHRLVNHGVAA